MTSGELNSIDSTSVPPALGLSELIDLLESLAAVPGESDGLSELDHGLQCAYELSCAKPEDKELQVAGLVHDIGHRFAPDAEHGRYGAAWVRPLLGDRVAGLVEAHVPAKRYLVATDASYGTVLSSGSTISLGRQGGPLAAGDVAEFEADPYFSDAVVLRRADDSAKTPGRSVPPLGDWLGLLQEVTRQ